MALPDCYVVICYVGVQLDAGCYKPFLGSAFYSPTLYFISSYHFRCCNLFQTSTQLILRGIISY